MKQILTEHPVLQYYDEKQPIVLSVDSSKDGMGAVLLQNNAPIEYASKSLTDTQKRYAQIEKEALAIAFGCHRFHQYLYGREFRVESDHKSLETILKEPLEKCPLRLQRIRINLQCYNFQVIYKPGSKLYMADTLSRASYDNDFKIFETEIEYQIGFIKYNQMSPKKYELLKNETCSDNELIELAKIIKTGWPTHKKVITRSNKKILDCTRRTYCN